MKLRAGILPFVLGISLLIASLSASLLLLSYYHSYLSKRSIVRLKLRQNCQSGLALLMNTKDDSYTRWTPLDLYGNAEDSVWVKKEQWGSIVHCLAKAIHADQVEGISAFIGHRPSEQQPALYVADHQQAVYLAGNALINGVAFLPEAGIKAGYVNSVGYARNNLVGDKTFTSSATLPLLNQGKTIEYGIGERKKVKLDESTHHVRIDYLSDSIGYMNLEQPYVLRGEYSGRVIIRSKAPLTISKEAKLDGIICIAPKIQFESGFQGSLQAFATDTILVEGGVDLHYPSVLQVQAEGNNALLEIAGGSHVAGEASVIHNPGSSQSFLKLKEGAVVSGLLYASGYLELQGELRGTAYADRLFLSTASATYENYLYNGKVDYSALADPFVFINLPQKETASAIMLWTTRN